VPIQILAVEMIAPGTWESEIIREVLRRTAENSKTTELDTERAQTSEPIVGTSVPIGSHPQ
jgi:hypothetical protein